MAASEEELRRRLRAADGRGYPAYRSLAGTYDLGEVLISIDHVQGDPFAAPSRVSVCVPAGRAGFPEGLYDRPHRRRALEDLLVRRFSRALARVSFKVGGSGKSGLLATSAPGPEVLFRSACEVVDGDVVARLEAGFPAHGRTADARALERMLTELVPRAALSALTAGGGALAEARAAVELADDQRFCRSELERLGLVAFIADGSVLPRASGVSSRPLAGALPLEAPDSLAVELELPHRGRVRGFGIPCGVTLVVGGGFHGKSTLLAALQEGVWDHVAGDGRELVVTDPTAMKLRAEDGRAVARVDISPFIDGLPDGRDTRSFSTADASGSTSQAASTVEAIEAGARTLLIDEDTSATNFMVRDELMEAVVAADREPITPFVERVRALWEERGVSCVIVVGSSGAFFPVADTVIQMDSYRALDITDRVRAVLEGRGAAAPAGARGGSVATMGAPRSIEVALRPSSPGRGGRGGRGRGTRPKVRVRGTDGFSIGEGEVDLRQVEQVADPEQAACLAAMVRLVAERGLLAGGATLPEAVAEVFDALDAGGWEALSDRGCAESGLAMPRPQELFCCLNRWRASS